MKHQRSPIFIKHSSDDESLPQGPLSKRQKSTSSLTTTAVLTLESLIRAGEALKLEDNVDRHLPKEQDEELPGTVTPTKELEDMATSPSLDRKMIQTALSDTLAVLEDVTPVGNPHSLPYLYAKEEKKNLKWFGHPLAAPPRLPNVPYGCKCV